MNGEWLYEKVRRVPEITDAQIAEMRHIEPVMLSETGMYRRMARAATVHPREESFLWGAEPVGEEFTFDTLNRTTVITQHKSAVFFKPSLAEVYAWIRFYLGDEWRAVTHFYMGDAHRIGGSSDIRCDCVLMGGRKLVAGKPVRFASGAVGHELVEECQ